MSSIVVGIGVIVPTTSLIGSDRVKLTRIKALSPGKSKWEGKASSCGVSIRGKAFLVGRNEGVVACRKHRRSVPLMPANWI